MSRRRLEALKLDGYAPRDLLDVGANVGDFTRELLQAFPDCVATLVETTSDVGHEGVIALGKDRLDDRLAGRRFDFVRIDGSGELDLLRGGKTLLRQADYVLVEVPAGDLAESVMTQMTSMGFVPADLTASDDRMEVLFTRRAARPSQFGRLTTLNDLTGLVAHLRARKAQNPDFRVLLIGGGPAGWPGDLRDAVLGGDSVAFPGDLSDPDTYRAILAHVAREGRFDYAVAPHVLQTLARPSVLLERLPLVAEVGWITTPSRYLEALKPEGEHRGFAHHRWGVDLDQGTLVLAPKTPLIEHMVFPGETVWAQALNRYELQVGWRGGLRFEILGGEGASPPRDEALALMGRFFEGVAADAAPASPPKLDVAAELAQALATARDASGVLHPLGRMKFYHDAVSLILCEPLTRERLDLFETLLAEAEAMDVRPPAPEWTDWVIHYRVVLEALTGAHLDDPTPPAPNDGPQTFLTGDGQSLDGAGLRAHADALGVQAVFFAAADERYVELYGRWLALSVLKHSDVPFLVVIHVIGGGERLAAAAATVRIDDPRVVFTGDGFDASAVTTKCYEAPPKGLIEIPVAHYQSVRFQRLGGLLELLHRPVFVSDIDLLLQRGVSDLLEKWPDADLVINENDRNIQAGSRITANLLLARPTPATAILLRWLRVYLDERLSRPTVTRWIDQVALNLARHHLAWHVPDAKIGAFDTLSDINNVMFSEYIPGHPFRFLSLYHGFDTSTLEE
ncbi:hypothetical protein ABIC66_001356 [Caulobacter sp. 1776]